MADEEIKILFVDDEENVLRAVKRIFYSDDYIILTATSGREGLDILEREKNIPVVLSDYRMPFMNGIAFLKEVYARWPSTIRIVFSGHADATSISSAITEGLIYKVISKPWDDKELKLAISNAIESHLHLRKEHDRI